jgi:teichuronic acid biosynthesis glycosyltransferase TuaC
MKILTFSTLYPNNIEEKHGVFVETRLRMLISQENVESIIVAPVPWFPLSLDYWPEYAKFKKIAKFEHRNGIDIYHPRYLVIPKIGMNLTPLFLALSSWVAIRKLRRAGIEFGVIDAHYFYPDGVAAIVLGKMLNIPVIITARGTDINLIPQYLLPRKMIQWAISKASHMITVCEALRQELIDLGAPADKVTTLRNGVDLDLFFPPEDFLGNRRTLNITRKTIITVGHLIERKGQDLIIEAIRNKPDVHLLIAGDGPEESSLRKLVEKWNLVNQVTFLGSLTQIELRKYYGACDAMVLASSREGWANVLLESMACGTPVIATNIWGTPEVVQNNKVGILITRTVGAISDGIDLILSKPPEREKIRAYAEQFDWSTTSEGQYNIMRSLV